LANDKIRICIPIEKTDINESSNANEYILNIKPAETKVTRNDHLYFKAKRYRLLTSNAD
jgi:hypothetical protein